MAFFDDRRFLLSHINHSFITGDDTGICEVVMLDEEVFKNQHKQCLKLIGETPENRLNPAAYDLPCESELLESEQGQSYDIASEMDYICHRRRSNTAQRLDRLKKEKITQSKTKTVVWPSSNNYHIGSSRNQTTDPSKVELPTTPVSTHYPPKKSGLTRLLERFPSIPKNPFDEFAQFDGGMSEILPVKKILIFIALNQNQSQQANNNNNDSVRTNSDGPLEVVIVSTAKVQDLIGLICWQYTNESREPKLNFDINRYCLRIAEDNGEVDPDFTSLNPKEPLSKFNFPTLALTEKTEERNRSQVQPSAINNQPFPVLPKVVPEQPKSSNVTGKISALVRIIFKDAKLDENR